jgi:predicted phage-related endonuclease
MRHFANYAPADREGWLALREEFRKRGVGGSELASVAGVPGAFGSALAEWADRRGEWRREEGAESAYLEDGRDIEGIVQKRFEAASGLSVRHRYAIITNDDFPHLFANVDGFVEGWDCGWEAKTYDVRSRKFEAGVPPSYVAQVTVYLAVTGRKRWVLSAWSYGQGTRHFFFTLDGADRKPDWADEMVLLHPSELDAAEKIAADFMRLVESGTPPAPDGSDSAGEVLRGLHPREAAGKLVDLSGVRASLDAIDGIDGEIKELERRREEQKQIVMEALGDAEGGTADGWKVTYRTVASKRLDAKAAKAAFGDGLEPFYKTTATRTLRIVKVA